MPAAMHEAAQALVGRHDFTTFRAAECQAKSPVATLDRLDVARGDEIRVAGSARSFLHHQVRSMVGHARAGRRRPLERRRCAAALEARDRTALRADGAALRALSRRRGLPLRAEPERAVTPEGPLPAAGIAVSTAKYRSRTRR